jgi:hypothetical protein
MLTRVPAKFTDTAPEMIGMSIEIFSADIAKAEKIYRE